MAYINKIKKYIDYLLPLVLWILIFGKNIFSQLMFVDYVPETHFNLIKLLILSNYTLFLNPLDLFKPIFSFLGLLPILFQVSILISMYISYFFIRRLFSEKQKSFIILFALIFFFNPFVYSRIMIGQLGVLLSYLFLPVTLYYIFNYFESNLKSKDLLKIILAITFTSLFSIHFFIINFILFIVSLFFFYIYKNHFSIKKLILILLVFGFLTIFLNAFWLQGALSNSIFQSIGSSHEDFFSPKLGKGLPAISKIIGMSGFWREDSYKSTFDFIGPYFYYILLFILIILFLLGYSLTHSKKSKVFFSIFWLGLILGTGISHPYTRPFFNSLFNYLPFFNGFRDSHKLVSLIALSYAYFIPTFIVKLKNHFKKLYFIPLILVILFIIFLSFPLIGLNNQIKPVNYPNSYFEIDNYLSNKQINGNIIYLPWQTYLTYNWSLASSSDGRINVPINQIIKPPVITGPDTYGSETIKTYKISICLEKQSIDCLKENYVEYILLDKCSLYQEDYTYLTKNLSIKAYSNACIDVYKLDINNKPYDPIPIRFLISLLISLLTLLIIILYIIIKAESVEVY